MKRWSLPPRADPCTDLSPQTDAADDTGLGLHAEGSLPEIAEGFQEPAQSRGHVWAAGPQRAVCHSVPTACRLLEPCSGDRVKEALDRGGRILPDVGKGFVRLVVGLFH